jgi:hypothetical protein
MNVSPCGHRAHTASAGDRERAAAAARNKTRAREPACTPTSPKREGKPVEKENEHYRARAIRHEVARRRGQAKEKEDRRGKESEGERNNAREREIKLTQSSPKRDRQDRKREQSRAREPARTHSR